MTITAQGSVFSFAVQDAKVGAGGTFTTGDYDWYRHRALSIQMGTITDQRQFPLEAGGSIFPTGAFRQGQFFGGQAEIIPRLENSFGWLLLAACGNVSSITGAPVVGANRHIFRLDPTDSYNIPWMAARVFTPGTTSAEDFLETGFDCKLNGMRIAIPAAGKAGAQLQIIGRDSTFLHNPGTPTYANTLEDSLTTPDAGRGSFSIGGTSYPAMGAEIILSNNVTTPQEEMILGSFNPDDHVARTRSVVINFQYKYENSELYQQFMTGTTTGTEWSPLPFEVETAGSDYAVDVAIQSPQYITGTTPYTLRIRGNRATIARQGPPQLRGGGIIVENYSIALQDPAVGNYCEFVLDNAVSNYTL